jgi:hypothetical protein
MKVLPTRYGVMDVRSLAVPMFLVLAGTTMPADSPGANPPLSTLLERLDRVAGLYRSGALDFTCVETVDYPNRNRDKYDYIYKVTDGVLEDHHVLRGLGKGSELRDWPKGVPDGIGRPSLWTGVFMEVRQAYNHYEIVGHAVVLGRPTILVSFEPLPGKIIHQVNDWIGTAWIDEATFQIVKIVAFEARQHARYLNLLDQYEQAGRKYEEAVAHHGKNDPKPEKPKLREFEMTTYSTLFGYVRNGMRFPTEVRTERRAYLVPGDRIEDPRAGHRMFLVLQSFDKYRFFSVRTAEEVTEIVLGQHPPD